MSVSITLPTDLEQYLHAYARHTGISVEALLTRTVVERWGRSNHGPGAANRESDLLLRLQSLFPPEQTLEYQTLCNQSDAGTLTQGDRARLLALVEQRDHQNAERLEVVAELADLRGKSPREMMVHLGIRPN